jgi:hypothetical protein
VADLLHDEGLKESPPWHTPFHRAGTGPSPSSLKLLDSGQIPVEGTGQVYDVMGQNIFAAAECPLAHRTGVEDADDDVSTGLVKGGQPVASLQPFLEAEKLPRSRGVRGPPPLAPERGDHLASPCACH